MTSGDCSIKHEQNGLFTYSFIYSFFDSDGMKAINTDNKLSLQDISTYYISKIPKNNIDYYQSKGINLLLKRDKGMLEKRFFITK